MKSKPGAAMVEMGDCFAVDRAISHLNNNMLFGQKLNVWCVQKLNLNLKFTLVMKSTMTLYVHVNLSFTHCLFVPYVISVSKQQAIMPGQSYQLEDGSCSFKDFHGNRNNRFNTAEQAAKNRIQQPSNVLHFFNSHPDSSVESFGQARNDLVYLVVLHLGLEFNGLFVHLQICEESGIKNPSSVKLFTGKSEL